MHDKEYLIFGSGGFGREVAQLLKDLQQIGGARFGGFIDDSPTPSELALTWGNVVQSENLETLQGAHFVVGISDPTVRQSVVARMESAGLLAATALIHPTAWVGSPVELGRGSIVCANSSITTNVRIGDHVHVNLNCTIGHDAWIGDYSTLSPGVHISGNARLGVRTSLGTGAVLLPGIALGDDVIVGAGSVVNRDVDPGLTVVGVPARPLTSR